MFDKDKKCLISIIDAIDHIEKYCKDFNNADDFYEDEKSFDATLMNFMVIGEMVNKLSENSKNIYSSVNWSKVKDFRNIITHNYFGIDAEGVWQIVKNDLPN